MECSRILAREPDKASKTRTSSRSCFLTPKPQLPTLRSVHIQYKSIRILIKCTIKTVLQVYSDIRRPRSQRILDLSVRTGMVYDGWGPSGFTKEGLKQDLKEIEEWMDEGYTYTLGKDVQEAVELMKEQAVFV